MIDYQLSIQTAFREVDDALIANRKAREIVTAQQRQLAALRDYARYAQLRFDEGQVSYIEVLDAERRLCDSELADAVNRADVYVSLVNVYKAMGGGWVEEAEAMTGQTDTPTEAQAPSS